MSRQQLVSVCVSIAVLLGFSSAFDAWAQKEFVGMPGLDLNAWKVGYQKRSGNTEIIEFVQKAETVEHWTKMLTVQKFKVDKKKGKSTSPIAAMEILKRDTELRCPTVKWNTIEKSELAILYEYDIEDCPQVEDQHELSILLIGSFTLFRIAYTEKGKSLAPEVRDEWLTFLRKTEIEIR